MAILSIMGRGHTYFPDELREKGYTGKVEVIPNACVLVIPKPGADDKDVAKSLRILAQDFDHKAKIKKQGKEDPRLSDLELNEDSSVSVKEDTKRSKEFGPKKLGKQYVFYDPETKRFRVEPVEK